MRIHSESEVPAQVRTVPQHLAMTILEAIHRYAETGAGRVNPLSGEFEGFLRLRVGNHRVFFKETAGSITIHRIRDRRGCLNVFGISARHHVVGLFGFQRFSDGAFHLLQGGMGTGRQLFPELGTCCR